MQSLSWKRYDDQYNLSELLTEAARACVDAWASNPGAFFASYFTKVTTGDNVDKLQCEKIFTPRGMLGLSLTIRLFTNATATTTAFFSGEASGSVAAFSDGEIEDGLGIPAISILTSLGGVSASAVSQAGNTGYGVPMSNISLFSGASSSSGIAVHHSGAGVGGNLGHEAGSGAGSVGLYHLLHGPGWQTTVIKALHRFIVDALLPELRLIPVTHQMEWDTLLETTKCDWSGLQNGGGGGAPSGPTSIGDAMRTESGGSTMPSGMHTLSALNSMGKMERDGDRLPSCVRFCFSLAAAVVAAKSNKKNLYEYFRGLYASIPRPQMTISGKPISPLSGAIHTGQGRDMYTLPRLLIPFFGRGDAGTGNPSSTGGTGANASGSSSNAAAATAGSGANTTLAPPGSLCFHTLYLLPATSMPSSVAAGDGSAMNKSYGGGGTMEGEEEEHYLASSTTTGNANLLKSDLPGKTLGGGPGDYSPSFEDDDTSSRGTNQMDTGSGGERGGGGSVMFSSHQNIKGLVTEDVFERLLAAYRVFSEKTNRPPVREDGAFVYLNVENVVDAVQLASDVVQAVGLRPGIDVCFGMRIQCPVIRLSNPSGKGDGGSGGAASNQPATTTSSSTGKGSKRGAKNADQGKVEEVMYGLFSGDPDVTGSQVAEYLAEQVQASHGLLVFLEDTHDPQNVAGLHRLMNRLGNRVVISGQGMYTSGNSGQSSLASGTKANQRPSLSVGMPPSTPPPPSTFSQQQTSNAEERREKTWIHQIEAGITSMWSHNITVPIRQVGTISRVMRLAMLLDAHSRSLTLLTRSDDRDLTHIIDLGISISASFISLGGLNLSTSCDAISYFLRAQEQLLRTRSLNDQPSIGSLTAGIAGLPPIPDEFVAEIKRKNDKKKKKTGKKS